METHLGDTNTCNPLMYSELGLGFSVETNSSHIRGLLIPHTVQYDPTDFILSL